MQKYGIKHFHIELIEETDNPEEREIYWISQFDSYHCGYNATKGGDGKSFVDKDAIYELYKKGYTNKQIALLTNHDKGWISLILRENYGVSKEELSSHTYLNKQKSVKQLSKDGIFIKEYPSLGDAAKAMLSGGFTHCKDGTGRTHISEVCQGKRKTFAGFKWQWNK